MTGYHHSMERSHPLLGRRRRPRRAAAAAATVLLLAAGCGGSPRRAVEGRVTVDGQPLAEGQVTFRPQPGTPGPTSGAEIRQGRFSIPRDKGPFAGELRVEITAWRKTGVKRYDPDLAEGEVELSEQYLPPRYNRQSELRAEVAEDGPNEFRFDLDTGAPAP